MGKKVLFSGQFRTIAIVLSSMLLVLSCVLPSVHALTVTQVDIEDLLQGTDVHEIMTISLRDNALSNITFGLPEGAKDVIVNGYNTIPLNGSVLLPLSCRSCKLIVSYTIPGVVVADKDDLYLYSRTLNLPEQPMSLMYDVHLPGGSILSSKENDTDPDIVPRQSEITTNGERITISWNELKPDLPKRYFIRFTNHVGSDSTNGLTFLGELTEWPVWILVVLMLLIGFFLGTIVQRAKPKPYKDSALPYVPLSLLNPDERAIIDVLRHHKQGVGQKEIGKQLNWSKSKVSAIMTNLQHKKIIHREKIGRNYTVTLIKAVEE